ncbi:Retrovirus-related Pol polyprotein from type-1 retrotransposable element [Trichinella papuae]|uniref:Retrovirus-related Pol polyprotein from type-1 retrotransposable element n=1 Tax=Trichinella papuae TaxID=268474 RepID=A0A0V1M3B1_9BILA|nr:Retrovirus-related Pol polyprotein from type-1 retrotransposable element [Trichinella papuae]
MFLIEYNKNSEARITVDQDKAQVILNRVRLTTLKPEQKVALIRSHLVPHLLFWFKTLDAECRKARLIDAIVRGSLKQILHSNKVGICSDFFHIACRDGGLGIVSRSHLLYWLQQRTRHRGRSLISIGSLSR